MKAKIQFTTTMQPKFLQEKAIFPATFVSFMMIIFFTWSTVDLTADKNENEIAK